MKKFRNNRYDTIDMTTKLADSIIEQFSAVKMYGNRLFMKTDPIQKNI